MRKGFNKKNRDRLLAISMASAIVFSGWTSVRAGAAEQITPVINTLSNYSVTDLGLTPGKNESELNLTWYTPRNPGTAVVQIAEKSKMTGDNFPAEQAMIVNGKATDAVPEFSTNKVTVTNLKGSTEYVYRVGDGTDEHWSSVYQYTTRNTEDYRVMLVGDPQIGASGNATTDTEGWEDTLKKAVEKFPDYSFIMSAGDQVNTSTSEKEYTGFFQSDVLRSLPLAPVVGNHDNSVNYKYHFNQPNESADYGVTNAGGDYYYTYGDTLFMVLNTNNMSGASHAAFMREAVAKNPNARWKMVTFHHSIYSAASHSTEAAIVNLRAALFPTIDELGIDMVLMGHDHSYVRTFNMLGDLPQKDQTVDENGRVLNPNGTTYVTANSASGSKYYTLKTTPEIYSEVRSQLKVPTFSNIHVTPNSLEVSTYRTDTMEEVDTYTLVKDKTAPTYTLEANGAAFADGAVFKDNQIVKFKLNAKDEISSVASQSLILDGKPYENGAEVDLAGKLGVHTLRILAVDKAGNTLDTTLSFKVETSISSMQSLLDRYTALGDVNGPLSKQLKNSLDQADHQLNKGSKEKAAKHMQDFLKHINNKPMQGHISKSVKDVLSADAEALINLWLGK
ncbi:FN3 domain-containing metallophosphoesterase family protein [Neobacillus novalis]|uniref:FN3 domain-containing metallophosphoesterase family protein n=1 Tax=Neobacillus novalis TaxID=220687 RepID=A0AA95MS55_9BACI|nr:FN3 domain-containing metallophosphoesterase family protein [Neobacillus novalis]WHY85593.1 FN3 domain-containing metallophosphoesterase family protein [Neobacillus novalis]